ncbi:hypothetical protein O3P69_006798 [Scylla paramamosain]|uniref:Uncharacterized protein n=1 Tax=Scylla paramamosain TaxID=85552 RepID=A0AAW0U4K5_SCYPA
MMRGEDSEEQDEAKEGKDEEEKDENNYDNDRRVRARICSRLGLGGWKERRACSNNNYFNYRMLAGVCSGPASFISHSVRSRNTELVMCTLCRLLCPLPPHLLPPALASSPSLHILNPPTPHHSPFPPTRSSPSHR